MLRRLLITLTAGFLWGSATDHHVKTYLFPLDRERNRLLSAWAAMFRLYRFLRQ